MRLTRSQTKRAAKNRRRKRSTDGPTCPHCEPRINGKLRRATILGRIAAKEMQDVQ